MKDSNNYKVRPWNLQPITFAGSYEVACVAKVKKPEVRPAQKRSEPAMPRMPEQPTKWAALVTLPPALLSPLPDTLYRRPYICLLGLPAYMYRLTEVVPPKKLDNPRIGKMV